MRARLFTRWVLAIAGTAALPCHAGQGYTLPPVAATPAPLSEVQVARIVVRGNTVLPLADIEAVVRPHAGRINSAAELESLREALTRLYTSRGYVNSGVLLPEQLEDGVLVLTAVEGRLSGVRLHGMERLDPAYLRTRLAGAPNEVLNVDRLRERFQLLLSDPMVARLNARMLPGAAPGEAVLDIDVLRSRPWQLALFANNYRPVAIGAQALGVRGSLLNLSGQGDRLDASIQGSPQESRGLRGSVNWTMPLGHRGTAFQFGADAGSSSVIEEATRSLDIRSRLHSVEAGFSHLLFESLQRKLVVSSAIMRRESQTWLLDEPFSFVPGEPDGHVRESLWRSAVDYSVRSETQVLAVRAAFTLGRNNVQAIGVLPSVRVPERSFQLWQGQLHYGRQVDTGGAQLVVRAAAQWSGDRLLALDALAVGGVNTVRGYRENLLVRDRGVYLNAEFDYPVFSGTWHVVPFIDYGYAQNVGEPGVSLGSAGIASRWQWRGLKVDIAVARRIATPAQAQGGNNLQDQGVHLQASYAF